MKAINAQLDRLFRSAIETAFGSDGRDVDPLIRASTDERFGDYQSNVAMSLAKKLGAKPRDVAQKTVEALKANPAGFALCEPLEIAGPGFINIRLQTDWLKRALEAIPPADDSDRLGIDPVTDPQVIVVDYSGPNIAKQMHVGHIRSTLIGDAIARILDFQGHRVIRQNHIGDWGTQFGMLIAYLKRQSDAARTKSLLGEKALADLETFYRQASALNESDDAFRREAQAEVVKLHQHNPATVLAHAEIVQMSRNEYIPLYQRLCVALTLQDERGESFYAEQLSEVTQELTERFGGDEPRAVSPDSPVRIQVRESDGALCVFHYDAAEAPVFKNAEGEPFPMIIRKSDGAYLYATTDLAALRFRHDQLHADRMIYVTDSRQALHFQMLFATARAVGWAPPEVTLDHVTFGTILGEDRKPLKTRSGENIKLAELLDEAVSRSEALVRANEADEAKRRGFTEAEIKNVSEAVGIGAIKYADLSQNRQSDYIFSWDKMLALEGNTAPYLMYAYARIRSIARKGVEQGHALEAGELSLEQPAERALGLTILRFPETLDSIATNLKLNLLTEYLYDLAGAYMKFYESCPVLTAETPLLRASRLRLCDLAARTLRLGLSLLGIRVLERM